MASCSPQSWTHDFRITAWSRIPLVLICLYVLLLLLLQLLLPMPLPLYLLPLSSLHREPSLLLLLILSL
jgi:hypothetical protein